MHTTAGSITAGLRRIFLATPLGADLISTTQGSSTDTALGEAQSLDTTLPQQASKVYLSSQFHLFFALVVGLRH